MSGKPRTGTAEVSPITSSVSELRVMGQSDDYDSGDDHRASNLPSRLRPFGNRGVAIAPSSSSRFAGSPTIQRLGHRVPDIVVDVATNHMEPQTPLSLRSIRIDGADVDHDDTDNDDDYGDDELGLPKVVRAPANSHIHHSGIGRLIRRVSSSVIHFTKKTLNMPGGNAEELSSNYKGSSNGDTDTKKSDGGPSGAAGAAGAKRGSGGVRFGAASRTRRFSTAANVVQDVGKVLDDLQGANDGEASSEGGSSIVRRSLRKNRLKLWFHMVPLQYKLSVITGIPIICAIVLTAIALQARVALKTGLSETQSCGSFMTLADSLVGPLQDEMLAARKYLEGPTPELKLVYELAVNETNIPLVPFVAFASSYSVSAAIQLPAYTIMIQSLVGISQHRKLILTHVLTSAAAFEHYDEICNSIFTLIRVGLVVSTSSPTAYLISSFANHLQLEYSVKLEILDGSSAINALGTAAYTTEVSAYAFRYGKSNGLYNEMLESYGIQYLTTIITSDEYVQALAGIESVRDRILNADPTITPSEVEDAFSRFLVAFDLCGEILTSVLNLRISSEESTATVHEVTLIALLVVITVVSCVLVLIVLKSIQETNRILHMEVVKRKTTEAAIWRFFPQEFMTLLNKTDIINVQRGDRRILTLTVLVTDIRSFTSTSEKLGPEGTYDWLTDYLAAVSPVIKRHRGFIQMTLGDGIVALFVDPRAAVQAAIDLQIRIDQLNLEKGLFERFPYRVGVGIHTGPVVLGTVGDDDRMTTSVISDTVTMAFKLEESNKLFESRIIVSHDTIECSDFSDVGMRYLGTVFRGASEVDTMKIFEVYQTDERAVAEFKHTHRDLFEEVMVKFANKDFAAVVKELDVLAVNIPAVYDGALQRFRRLSAQYAEKGVPDSWHSSSEYQR